MLGGVPMSVVMPPRSDAKARGIRKREGGSLLRPDTLIATGMRSVTAPHVVYEGGEERRQAGQRRHTSGEVWRNARQPTGYDVDNAGLIERPAQDQHGGDRDHCRMAETAKCLRGRHDAGDSQDEEGQQGDDVVAPPTRHEEDEGKEENSENDSLIHQTGILGAQ